MILLLRCISENKNQATSHAQRVYPEEVFPSKERVVDVIRGLCHQRRHAKRWDRRLGQQEAVPVEALAQT